jgi:hypothetical protein
MFIPLFAFKVYNEIAIKEAAPAKIIMIFLQFRKIKFVLAISEIENWNNIRSESENKSLMGWIENSALGNINV